MEKLSREEQHALRRTREIFASHFQANLFIQLQCSAVTHFPSAVLVLNEVDKLSKEAQHSLRRTMEKYSAACRLVLCCNSASKVIEAVRSRCLPVRVNLPSHEEVSINQERQFAFCLSEFNQERRLLITFQILGATITMVRYCATRCLELCCDGAYRVIEAVGIRYLLNRVNLPNVGRPYA